MPAGTDAKPLAPSSQDRHRQAARHVSRLLGSIPLTDLTAGQVKTAFATLATEGHSRASIVKVCNTLSIALQSAAAVDLVPFNVARDRKHLIPASAARRQPRNALTAEQARKLLSHLRGQRNGLAVALCLRLGLRPGESYALCWDQVTDEHVNIVRGIGRSGGKAYLSDSLKVDTARRTLTLPADLVEWFHEHRDAEQADTGGTRLVFTSEAGELVDPANARRQLTQWCGQAGVPRLRPNECRHTAATLLADSGVSDEGIAATLGHVDTRMARTYTENRERRPVDVAAQATWAEEI